MIIYKKCIFLDRNRVMHVVQPVPEPSSSCSPCRRFVVAGHGTVCPRCLQAVPAGWTLHNHRKYVCKATVDEPVGVELPEMDGGMDDMASSDDDDDEAPEVLQDDDVDEVTRYFAQLDAAGTLDTAYVEQYIHWGKVNINEGGRQTLRFLAAMFCGNGSSGRTAGEVLKFIHTVNGTLYSLPTNVSRCWQYVEKAHASLTRKPSMVRCSFPVPIEVQLLMSKTVDHIVMDYVDPTEALVRLLVCSPLAADPANLALFPEESEVLDDYCNGARMRRIHNVLPAGSAALTGILFFDEINQDKKGFTTGEGAIIVGGFFRKEPRESTYAKYNIGTFPGVMFPKVCPA